MTNREQPVMMAVEDLVAGYRMPLVGPVSFSIRGGEVLGIGGPNGSGKTTILNAITGTARVWEGRIRRAPGLSVMHHRQRPELPPELPILGRELLRLSGADAGEQPDRIRQLMDRPLARMSGGQFQLLQAWACLAGGSALVLLDEPTNNLDASAMETISDKLHGLPGDRGVMLVSHERDFLAAHCDRIVEIAP